MENSLNYERGKIPFLLPIRCVLLLTAFLFISLISKLQYSEISKWWTAVCVVCNIITILILYFYCRKKGITYKNLLNYEKGKTKAKTAILITVIIISAGIGSMYLAGLICYGVFPYMAKMMIEPIPLSLAIVIVFLLPISTTIAEDGLYLGYTINLSKSKWSAILPAALFYALQHCFVPFLPDGIFILYRFLSFLPLTLIICFWYQKNKDPLPFMIGHFIINIATVAQILLMTISPELYYAL